MHGSGLKSACRGLLKSTLIFGQISKLTTKRLMTWGWSLAFSELCCVGESVYRRRGRASGLAAIKERAAHRECRSSKQEESIENVVLAMGAGSRDGSFIYTRIRGPIDAAAIGFRVRRSCRPSRSLRPSSWLRCRLLARCRTDWGEGPFISSEQSSQAFSRSRSFG